MRNNLGLKPILFCIFSCLVRFNFPAVAGELQPMGLTISGGVSLGSYEAGFLHYLIEFSKLNPRMQFPVITGASAGAINTLLAGISKCDASVQDYERSLFWKAWIPVGLQQFSNAYSKRSDSIFSIDSVRDQIESYREHMRDRPSYKCETLFGIALTRSKPVSLQLTDELAVPKFSETVLIKMVQEKSPGKQVNLRVYNFSPRRVDPNQILLPFDGNFDHDFDLLIKVVAASASFPGVFEPENIPYCLTKDRCKSGVCLNSCSEKDSVTAEFIDGGLFENQPLKASLNLANEQIGSKSSILLVDPASYDSPKKIVDPDPDRDLFSLILDVHASFLERARKGSLTQLVEDLPEVKKRIIHSASKIPLNSEGLGAFLGFLESDFRKGDFIYGMYEARRFLIKHFNLNSNAQFPEYVKTHSWEKFRCFSQVLDGESHLSPECAFLNEEEKDLNELILLQVGLDRLYLSCKQSKTDTKFPMEHCLMAKREKISPLFLRLEPKNSLERERLLLNPGTSNLKLFLKLLELYHFEFRDLGLGRKDSKYGNVRINQELFRLAKNIASRQPEPHSSIIQLASKPLLDFTTGYTPVNHILEIDLGTTQKVGWNSLITRGAGIPLDFRYLFGLRTQGFSTFFSGSPQFAVTPFGGIDLLYKISGTVFQLSLGSQFGRQFGSDDYWGGQVCTPGPSDPIGWGCSGWAFSSTLTFTVFDRLRLQYERLSYLTSNSNLPTQNVFHVGYQFLFD